MNKSHLSRDPLALTILALLAGQLVAESSSDLIRSREWGLCSITTNG